MPRWYAFRARADDRRHAPGPATLIATQQEVLVERIAFVGLGTMGAAMAANLRRAGFEVTVWNRTPGRAADLVAQGASEAATPADAARLADVVVTCVSDTPDVDAVLFGPDGVAEDRPETSAAPEAGAVGGSGGTASPGAVRRDADSQRRRGQ